MDQTLHSKMDIFQSLPQMLWGIKTPNQPCLDFKWRFFSSDIPSVSILPNPIKSRLINNSDAKLLHSSYLLWLRQTLSYIFLLFVTNALQRCTACRPKYCSKNLEHKLRLWQKVCFCQWSLCKKGRWWSQNEQSKFKMHCSELYSLQDSFANNLLLV